jgi:hypothetical protein
MSKRKRDASDGECDTHVKIESVVKRILSAVSKWVDPCGCSYNTEHHLTREKDTVVLKVGFFDSLTCKQICDVIDTPLQGDYTIRNVLVDLHKRTIVFYVQRLRRDALNSAQDALNDARCKPEASPMDMMKLRITYSIASDDVAAVQHTVNELGFCLPRASFKVASKPASYAVVFTCKDTVTLAAVRFAAERNGVVDMDHKQLVVDVKKTTPDIVC